MEKLINWRDFKNYSQRMLEAVRTSCSSFKPLIEKGEFIFYCTYCNKHVNALPSNDWNLRNSITCKECMFSGRERHALEVIIDFSKSFGPNKPQIACFESVTLFARKLKDIYPTGYFSEYVSNSCISGELSVINSLNIMARHEDITNTSYEEASIDLVVHRDIYEHIPSIRAALTEAYRILSAQGLMIFTMPLYDFSQSRQRCDIINDKLINYCEQAFHGNPLSKEGSLVFSDPGIDFFDLCEEIGFDTCVSIGYDVVKGYFPDCNPFNDYHSWNICIVLKKLSSQFL